MFGSSAPDVFQNFASAAQQIIRDEVSTLPMVHKEACEEKPRMLLADLAPVPPQVHPVDLGWQKHARALIKNAVLFVSFVFYY